MATDRAGTNEAVGPPIDETMVDPRAPRFGQSITALGMAAFVATGNPAPLFAVAVVLAVSVLSGWRLDLYGVLWRRAVVPLVGPPPETEPASPHRFAKLLGAGFTAVASLLWLANLALAAVAMAALVGGLAGVAAAFDLCVGCRMYEQVRFVRELGVV